jgi:hypothetical protein
MKLEDLAQNAARQARNAAQEMPIVPIKDVSRQRRTIGALVPILGVAATWIVIAVLTPPPVQTPSIATNPTATSVGNTQTTNAVPNVFETVVVTDSDIASLPDRTDSIIPNTAVDDVARRKACCLAAGQPGEVLKLESRRVLSVRDQNSTVLVTWDDILGRALVDTPDGIVVSGLDASGDPVLRLSSRDNKVRWSMPLELGLGENPQLALGADRVIWQGVRDLFPEESGFAALQWIPVATLDGRPVVESGRSEFRPLPDGRSIGMSEHSASLTGPDGTGTRWELPSSLSVLSADPFLDGILVAATDEPNGESGKVVSLFLRPGAPATGLSFDRYWGPVIPGPTTIVANNKNLYILTNNDEGTFISVASLATLYPLPPFTVEGVEWISVDHETIRSADGTVLARGRYAFPGRPSGWDGSTGVVTFGDDGLRWMQPDGESAPPLPSEAIAEIVEVVAADDGHIVGARLLDSFDTIIWFDLESGAPTEPPARARTLDGVAFAAGGRTATIALPDWSNVQRGEGGGPLLPYDLPELVISGDDGTELLRVTVGTNDRPYVQIHDFDGRRLILTAVPQEPASPPQTVWIIDLECSECTEVISNGHPVWFDLIGTLESTGGVVEPILPGEATRLWP